MSTESGQVVQATWKDYFDLCKPKVVLLLVITAMVGVVLASPPGEMSLFILVVSSIGIGLGSAAGAAINQLVELESDAQMARTEGRPLPQGRIDQKHAFIFASFLSLLKAADTYHREKFSFHVCKLKYVRWQADPPWSHQGGSRCRLRTL